ncbi:hypothetical protein [Marisediminicola senii]|uniref:hypothetical protein n=1 Tax=Marisediminicola senii TaxID=2711233 RepID=UPI0013EE1C7E|nr:hypothetical protein [Marisediminicola senii]
MTSLTNTANFPTIDLGAMRTQGARRTRTGSIPTTSAPTTASIARVGSYVSGAVAIDDMTSGYVTAPNARTRAVGSYVSTFAASTRAVGSYITL